MMLFRDEETGMYIPLEVLAMKLAPLLAQRAPADVPAAPTPDWTTAPGWAQWWAADLDGWAYWYERKPIQYSFTPNRWISDGKGGQYRQDTAERVTLDYPGWRDSLTERPAAVPSEVEQLRQEVKDATAERDSTRAELKRLALAIMALQDDKSRLAGAYQMAFDALSGATVERDELRDHRDALQAERDELAAQWAAIPWSDIYICAKLATNAGQCAAQVVNWFNTNRPERQE